MLHSFRAFAERQLSRLRDRRLAGLLGALLAESLLVLVVLSLGMSHKQPRPRDAALTSMTVRQEAEKKPQAAKPEPARTAKAQPRPQPSRPATIPVPAPVPSPALLPLPKILLPKFDIANLPRPPQAAPAPGKPMMGPPNLAVAGDSKRVGSAPNGEPMYAAAWYREPSDDELSGFLSTASGPGWALIACRTVADFRVEDCVGLDEYPSGSQIQRAVLAAAWQFRVRPPRRGGVSRVGEWVRIRISYEERRR